MKNPKVGKPIAGTDAVALPASTGDGVVTEVSASDALNLTQHQNDDLAGDLAADLVTRPVVAVGAFVEPVNPVLASEPAVTGDAAGDAAIVAAGAAPLVAAPFTSAPVVDAPTTAADGDAIAASAARSNVYEPGRSFVADLPVDYVIFDLTRPPTQEERDNLKLVLRHLGSDLSNEALVLPSRPALEEPETLLGEDTSDTPLVNRVLQDFYASDKAGAPYIRITAKIAGFRRGGRAHPAEAVEYRLDVFTPEQVEAILNEPQLVAEIF